MPTCDLNSERRPAAKHVLEPCNLLRLKLRFAVWEDEKRRIYLLRSVAVAKFRGHRFYVAKRSFAKEDDHAIHFDSRAVNV